MLSKVILSVVIVGQCLSFPFPDGPPSQLQQYGPPSYTQPKQSQELREDVYGGPQPKRAVIEPYHRHQDPYKEETRPYKFDYGVRDDYTGANFGHQEDSDGNTIKGSYSVALPDGRIQKVNYIADHYNGFQAEVTYEGEATYPEYKPAEPSPYGAPPSHKSQPLYQPKPQYSAPRPTYQLNPRYKEESPVFSTDEVAEEY